MADTLDKKICEWTFMNDNFDLEKCRKRAVGCSSAGKPFCAEHIQLLIGHGFPSSYYPDKDSDE